VRGREKVYSIYAISPSVNFFGGGGNYRIDQGLSVFNFLLHYWVN
jgi:hypothetical protein